MSEAVYHEFDENGKHRIRVDDATGDWFRYEDVAVLTTNGWQYQGRSNYFVTPETVERTSVPASVDHTQQAVCYECGAPFTRDDAGVFLTGCEHVQARDRALTDMLRRAFNDGKITLPSSEA